MTPVASTNETLHLTLTLPKGVAQHLHDQVAAGAYASESEYVESMLLSETLFDPIDQDELTHWMNNEGARRLEALHRKPASGLTSEQAFAGLLDEELPHEEHG